jgi:hypothetical protein
VPSFAACLCIRGSPPTRFILMVPPPSAHPSSPHSARGRCAPERAGRGESLPFGPSYPALDRSAREKTLRLSRHSIEKTALPRSVSQLFWTPGSAFRPGHSYPEQGVGGGKHQALQQSIRANHQCRVIDRGPGRGSDTVRAQTRELTCSPGNGTADNFQYVRSHCATMVEVDRLKE